MAEQAVRRNDEGGLVVPTFEVGDLVRHIPMGDGRVLDVLGHDVYKAQFDHGHIVEVRAGWYIYKVGTAPDEQVLGCPKCHIPMAVDASTQERSCTCGLRLPPYPLEWPSKGIKGGRRERPPEWVMTLAFELADNYGPLVAGRLLDIHPNVISGWRNKYRKDQPRWATGPHVGPRTRGIPRVPEPQRKRRLMRTPADMRNARLLIQDLTQHLAGASAAAAELTILVKEK